MKKGALLILLIGFTINSYAAEMIPIDDMNMQEFKGRIGKWLLVTSHTTLASASKEYAVLSDEIYAINGISMKKETMGNYVFVPYSEAYIAQLAAKGITRAKIESAQDEFLWPIEKVNNISSVLGLRGGRFHTGMDIPAERGKSVRAAMDGRVVFSGYLSGFGSTIEIEHRNNFITKYSHNSINLVKKGDFVKKGQYIGFVGSTGNSTGNHLHFEIRCSDVPLDPLDFLPKNGSIKMPHALKNWK